MSPSRKSHERSGDDPMLLRIRCKRSEANIIREAAKRDRRGISQFVLHVLLRHIGQGQDSVNDFKRPQPKRGNLDRR